MKAIKEMNASCVNVTTVNRDWTVGYTEEWDCHQASQCEKCGAVLVGTNGEKHSDLDGESDCDGYVPQNDGPMMSYYYPLPEWGRYGLPADETARLLEGSNLCLVQLLNDDEWGLALTGGGMDFSWEICEAFMRLGLLPPFHFCDLPQMADRGRSKRDRWIIAGCRASAQVVKRRAGATLRRIRENFKAAPKA